MGEAEIRRHETMDVVALKAEAVYKSSPAAILSILGSVMGATVYWGPGTRLGLVIWVLCVSSVAIVHLIANWARGREAVSWHPKVWLRIVTGVYLCAGLAWGIGGAWMLHQGNVQQALVICCLAMGAVTVTFPTVVHLPAYNAFQTPIFVAFAVGLVTSPLEFGWLMAIASISLCVFLALIAHGMGSQLVLALRLSHENFALATELDKRKRELERVNRDLVVQNSTDPLTGIANRRRLMSFARSAPARCAVLIIDVDHFKAYNDRFGHADGDVCLTLVAETLERSARDGIDLVARHGGEEFAVVLSDVTEARAHAVAEQIRQDVQTLHKNHAKEIRQQVTVSVGLSWRDPDRPKTMANMMDEADSAVYVAKRGGRNQVHPRSPLRFVPFAKRA